MKTKKGTFYSEYEGSRNIVAEGYRSKEKAFEAMKKELIDNDLKDKLNIEKITESTMWYCKECEFSSWGDDNICCECGEVIKGNGRHIFVHELESEYLLF